MFFSIQVSLRSQAEVSLASSACRWSEASPTSEYTESLQTSWSATPHQWFYFSCLEKTFILLPKSKCALPLHGDMIRAMVSFIDFNIHWFQYSLIFFSCVYWNFFFFFVMWYCSSILKIEKQKMTIIVFNF